jgi:hypothetical protein
MRKVVLFWLFLAILPVFSFAETKTDEKRKVQEESRQILYSTESALSAPSSVTLQKATLLEKTYLQQFLAKKYLLRSDILAPLLILLGENADLDLPAQARLLKEKRVITERIAAISWEEPLDKGLAAQLFCRALGIKGGLIMRLFGIRPRTAFNELVFLRLMPQGSQHEILNGREFLVLFANARKYLADKDNSLRHKEIK